MVSSGELRRLVHPFFLRLWLKYARDRELTTTIDGLSFRVLPTVFHPRFFGSSVIFAEYVAGAGVRGKNLLDLGTGSGIVGIFSARAGAHVTAVDINPQAVVCASANAANARVKMDCRHSDLFATVPERFDVIAWNPPFFPKSASTAAEAALFAGDDYAVVRRFARELATHLNPGGRTFLILSEDLDLGAWNDIFGGRLIPRHKRRCGLETMVVMEIQ